VGIVDRLGQAASSKGGEPQDDVANAARQFNDWITSAGYPLHSRLPTERELAVMLGLPRGKVPQKDLRGRLGLDCCISTWPIAVLV